MSFTYAGAISGQFATTGSERSMNKDGAIALEYETDLPPGGVVHVVRATRIHSRTRSDELSLMLLDVAGPQTIQLGSASDGKSVLSFSFTKDQPVPFRGFDGETYQFRNGAIVVTSVSATRIAGTFHGTAEGYPFNGTKVISVTDGKFDVPVFPLVE